MQWWRVVMRCWNGTWFDGVARCSVVIQWQCAMTKPVIVQWSALKGADGVMQRCARQGDASVTQSCACSLRCSDANGEMQWWYAMMRCSVECSVQMDWWYATGTMQWLCYGCSDEMQRWDALMRCSDGVQWWDGVWNAAFRGTNDIQGCNAVIMLWMQWRNALMRCTDAMHLLCYECSDDLQQRDALIDAALDGVQC